MLRGLPGPVFFPLRVLAIVYTDFFRGVPTILVISLLGFGAPGAAAHGRARPRRVFWADVALILVYSGVRRPRSTAPASIGAPEPGGGRALARPVARAVAAASWSCRRRCGGWCRRS